MGSKSEGAKVVDYFMSLHYAICVGPVVLRAIWVGEEQVWSGKVSTMRAIEIDDHIECFGGDEQEGGVGGIAHFLPGLPDQVLPGILSGKMSLQPEECPAYRGIATLFMYGANEISIDVFEMEFGFSDSDGFFWGTNNPYLKETSVEATHVPETWYGAKAPITRTIGEPPIEGYTTWGALTANAQWKFDTLGFRNAYAERLSSEIKLWSIPDNTLTTITHPDVVGAHLSSNGMVISRDGAGDVLYFDFSGNLLAQVTGTLGLLLLNSRCAICDITVGGEHITFIMASAEIGGDPRQYVRVTDHAGWVQAATTDVFPDSDFSLGPEYAYVYASASTVYLVDWAANPITSAAVTPPGLTGNIANVAYDSLTNSVVIVCTNGDLLRYSPDLTALIISNTTTGIGSVETLRNSNKRMCSGDGSVVIARQAGGGGTAWHVHVFSTSTLTEIAEHISTAQPTWNNPTNVYDHVKFNSEFQSVLMVDHFITGSMWFFPDADKPDMNPAHMIYHAATNTDWGMGTPTSNIDDAAFVAAADVLFAEEFGLSILWLRQTTIEEFVKDIQDHINARVFTHPATGLLSIKLIRDDYDPNTLPVLDRSNSKILSFGRKAWADIVNEVTVTWTDPETEKPATVTVQDLGNIAMQGEVSPTSKNYHGIRKVSLAKSCAVRDLAAEGWPLASGQVEVSRFAWDYVPGGVVKLAADEYGVALIIMRILRVDYGRPGESRILLDLAEDIFSVPRAEYVDEAPRTRWVSQDEEPRPIDHALPQTLPYFYAKKVADISGAEYPEVLAGMLAAQGGSDTRQFRLLGPKVDAAGNETPFANLGNRSIVARATLAAPGLDAEAETVLTSASWEGKTQGPSPRQGGFVLVGSGAETANELALVAAASDGSYTLKRGVLDTTPRAWPAGTPIWFFSTATRIADLIPRAALDTILYKVLPITSKGTLPANAASSVPLTLTGRPWLPSRPANVKVDAAAFGIYDAHAFYGGAVPATLDVTWARRNRVTEDTQVLWWDGADVLPEAGQTTTIRVLKESDRSVITTHAGLTGTSFSLPVASFGGLASGIVRVTSVRDGFESLQGHEIVVIVAPIGAGVGTAAGVGAAAAVGSGVLGSAGAAAGIGDASAVSEAAGPGAHRYWRVYIEGTFPPNSRGGAAEVEFRLTAGGADETGSGTAIASQAASGGEAANAFDNNIATEWFTNIAQVPAWIGYDFGSGNDKEIRQVAFTASLATPGRSPLTGDIGYSDDGTNWTVALTLPTQATWAGNETRLFTF